MTDVWSTRAAAFRESAKHRAGPGLDLVVEWCEPGPGVRALDVATGGGHVARRLREAGCDVVSCDPAPGMRPDVICRAEDLPFAAGSFDVVACRSAAHHFDDVRAAVSEMARVSRRLVVIEDLVYEDEPFEEAQRVRDPTHVRTHAEQEWRELLGDAGLAIERLEVVESGDRLGPWLERVDCRGADADRVRELLAGRLRGDWVPMRSIFVRAVKADVRHSGNGHRG